MTPIIVALDYPNMASALEMAAQLDPKHCRVKVGKELFTACGPQVVEALQLKGFEVFLDLKFHDIPNTVAGACRSAAELGVWMVNIHVSSGRKALERVVSELSHASKRPLLIGMTILSSLDSKALEEVGINCKSVDDLVLQQAIVASEAGLDGVVCSAPDLSRLQHEVSDDFIRVTPGIRPEFAAQDDQNRVATPRLAIESGSTYLVIGRPITKHVHPQEALQMIMAELS